jgi:16S rRNA (cytosine967-C5)-methyltransferase
MALKQRELLKKAWDLLLPGGELVYAVCSFEPEETNAQLDFARTTFGEELLVVNPAERLPDYYRRYNSKDQMLLIYSGNADEADGFGAFILQKKA